MLRRPSVNDRSQHQVANETHESYLVHSDLTETKQSDVLDIRTIMLAHRLQALRQVIDGCHIRATQREDQSPKHDQVLLLQHAIHEINAGSTRRARALRCDGAR